MKTASLTQSNNGLSNLLRAVVKGGKTVDYDHNVPVARLEPISPQTLSVDA
jgi:antitoxin (DNA-binding transcriptional repressor) of toxin-antitoxin stability system